MNIWHDISPDRITKTSFDAVIEISKGSKMKYELDKETGLLRLDRVLYTSNHYPANYGFIPRTYAKDNDPLDVLVLCSEQIEPMALVKCYPIGVITMLDNGFPDDKIISIPFDDPMYNSYTDITQLPAHISDEMKHFFSVYKTLENKKTVIDETKGAFAAADIVEDSIKRYTQVFEKEFLVWGEQVKNKAVKIFMVLIVAVVAIFGTVAIVNSSKNGWEPSVKETKEPKTKKAAPVAAVSDETVTAEKKEPVKISMLSVGDNLIHDGIYEQAKKRSKNGGYDFSYAYKNIASTVEKADLATINQETIIAKSYEPSGYPLFNSPQEVGEEVKKIGFDVVNLANNHMLDKGAKGLSEAIDFWNNIGGITMTGAYKDENDMNRLEYIEKDGIKIGLVGITRYTNGLSLPKDSALKIIYTSDEDTIKSKIQKAKAECDIVLVNVHWGEEYTTTPNNDQRELASKMASWGADVIIGHHPHVIQPVEWIDNGNGTKTLVAYSLGNFLSQQNTASRVIGGMLHYDLTKDYDTGKTTVDNVVFEPIVTHYVRGSHDVQIYPLSQYTDSLAKAQASRLKQNDFSIKYINDFVGKVIDKQFLNQA